MVESPNAFCNMLNVSTPEISFRKQNLMHFSAQSIRHCKNRKMYFWSFGKHKRKYITDNDIHMKFGPDVINSLPTHEKITRAKF